MVWLSDYRSFQGNIDAHKNWLRNRYCMVSYRNFVKLNSGQMKAVTNSHQFQTVSLILVIPKNTTFWRMQRTPSAQLSSSSVFATSSAITIIFLAKTILSPKLNLLLPSTARLISTTQLTISSDCMSCATTILSWPSKTSRKLSPRNSSDV